jgi:integrase
MRALRRHLRDHGTAPDGRLFRRTRGGMLSESVYGRAWHAARQAALGPELAATALARRPYDLRHAALSLWLNASGAPAEVAARAGNSTRVLYEVYLHCIDGKDDLVSHSLLTFPQFRWYLKRYRPKPGDGRIRPTHSPWTQPAV